MICTRSHPICVHMCAQYQLCLAEASIGSNSGMITRGDRDTLGAHAATRSVEVQMFAQRGIEIRAVESEHGEPDRLVPTIE